MKKNLLHLVLLSIPLLGFSQSNVLLSENFQSGSLPASWTVTQSNTVETWHVEDPLSGTDYRATVNYDESTDPQDEWLITPSLDFSASTTYTLTASVGLSYYWSVDPEDNYDVFIKVSKDNGATWTQVWSETDLGTFTNWVMNPITVNLSSYAGNANVKVAFQYVGADGAALYVDNVKIQKPATVAPGCATQVAPANGAVGIAYTSPVTLSWTAPTTGEAAASYDVFLGTTANPTTLLGNVTGTTTTAPGLLPSTTYYWKVTAKNSAGSATGCTEFSFTTAANLFAPYCGPLVYSSGVEPITSVVFGGMTNTSAAALGGTAHESFVDKVANVTKGGTFPIKLQGNTGGAFTTKFIVFIDWNQDGDFLDAGETYFDTAATTIQVASSTGVDGKEATGNIVVPATALTGNTRMRIKKNFGATTFYPNPCFSAGTLAAGANTGYGQAEDYTVNVGVLAVSDLSKNGIKSYPNPVKDIYTIETQGKIKSVKVFDVTGKQLLTKDINEAKSQIDFSKFNSGVYVVNITMEDGSTTSNKVIKK